VVVFIGCLNIQQAAWAICLLNIASYNHHRYHPTPEKLAAKRIEV
jgi:hypothetical protein